LMAVMVGAVTVRYELINNTLVMSYICVTEYLILLGIYAATLSSAIASLVGAPRILQAVARDQIFPWKILEYFAVADKDGNPIRGYFLSFGVAFCCNLIGELNAIAPLISQFFMLTYLLINLACFALTISKSPGWRPSFKYFNKWTAGFGSFLCLSIMFLLAWYYALIACTVASVLYFYVEWVDPEVNWGAAPQARKYYTAYKSILRLRKTKKHIKNWRPGLLVLVRDPLKRPQLMIFAQTLKKSHGPVFYATMKELINQFRLPYEGPLLVPARKAPHPKTVATFEKCAGMKLREVPRPSVVSKWLILSELLFEYSRFSGLNVVTLPIPTKRMKPRAYMALLHMLTDQKRMPPTLIMRGNGESTLTFYSE